MNQIEWNQNEQNAGGIKKNLSKLKKKNKELSEIRVSLEKFMRNERNSMKLIKIQVNEKFQVHWRNSKVFKIFIEFMNWAKFKGIEKKLMKCLKIQGEFKRLQSELNKKYKFKES